MVDLHKCRVHVKKTCCICCLCWFCCWWCGTLIFCISSRDFFWFFTHVTTFKTVVCVSIKYLINSSFEKIFTRWNSKSNYLFLTWHFWYCFWFFNVSCKTNKKSLIRLLKLIFHKLQGFWEPQIQPQLGNFRKVYHIISISFTFKGFNICMNMSSVFFKSSVIG